MVRFHSTENGNVQFSDAEETARDAEEAQVAADEPQKQWSSLRAERDAKLLKCDWTQGDDSPLTDEVKASWATYRENLRDLPANTGDPDNPTWPDVP
jgi:hypothetical protein